MSSFVGKRICDHCGIKSVDHIVKVSAKEGKGDITTESWCLACMYKEGKARSDDADTKVSA